MSIDLNNLEARLRIVESLVKKAADHNSAVAAHDHAIRSLIDGMNLLITEVKGIALTISITQPAAEAAKQGD